jgi:MoxR-like ATPase
MNVASLENIVELQRTVKKVHVSEEIGAYIVALINGTRQDPDVSSGPSTRASVALFKGSRALAFLQGRDYVLPDDVKKLVLPVLVHRLRVKPEAEMENVTPKAVVDRVLSAVAVPKI